MVLKMPKKSFQYTSVFYILATLIKAKMFKRTFSTKMLVTYSTPISIFITYVSFTFIAISFHKYPVGELNSCLRREKPMS